MIAKPPPDAEFCVRINGAEWVYLFNLLDVEYRWSNQYSMIPKDPALDSVYNKLTAVLLTWREGENR